MAKKKILVVEDNRDISDLLKALFESEGFAVDYAYDGQEALNYLDELGPMGKLPDVILMDIMMPVMDGIQFRKRQAQNEKYNKIPIVFLSADPGAEGKAASVGVERVVLKPANLDTLVTEIRSIIAS